MVKIKMDENICTASLYNQSDIIQAIKDIKIDKSLILADMYEDKLLNKKICLFDKLSLDSCERSLETMKELYLSTVN